MSSSTTASNDELIVQIASYNTNLQGESGLPQDLVDWLSPTLTVSGFLTHERRAPDIVAVGFQELLPLHLGLSGFSQRVLNSRDALIRSQIEQHAPNKERYSLVARIVNVGVALLVYVRDDEIGRRVCDVQTQWTGCGPVWMGNKGAVGIRFRVCDLDDGPGEIFTFVNAHLTAHQHKLAHRIADYHHIVGTLLFPSTSVHSSNTLTTIYGTSHLFFLGDLNFRVDLPSRHPLKEAGIGGLIQAIYKDDEREKLKEHDQLHVEKRKGSIFIGLREGEFWRFQCTYKYHLNEVNRYNTKRIPSWTDRILYTTYTDSPESPDISNINNVLYTSIPSYTTSDHKPIVAVLQVPTSLFQRNTSRTQSIPLLNLPISYKPILDPQWRLKRHTGRILGRFIGFLWSLIWLVGLGNTFLGAGNVIIALCAWTYHRSYLAPPSNGTFAEV